MLKLSTVVACFALLSSAVAQTYTDCNPLTNSSCPSDTGLSSSTYSVDFTSGSDDSNWLSVGSGDVTYTSSGAEFTISAKGDAPTIETNWYIFFGRMEVQMKAAPGTGIVSCAILLSDDLDEIDWEWLGGSANEVQTDYFGKGNETDGDRGGISTVSDTQGTSHNYTVVWTAESCIWYIDGTVVRTLTYAEALDGANYPQTPMRVKLGIWAGGDSDNAAGTIAWAGGETNYSDGPYTMTVESVKITNDNPAASYTYGDDTGDYTSIKKGDASSSDSSSSSSASSATSSVSKESNTESSTSAAGTATATTVQASASGSVTPSSNSTASATSTATPSSTVAVGAAAGGLGASMLAAGAVAVAMGLGLL